MFNEPTKDEILKTLVEEAIECLEAGAAATALELLKEIKLRLEAKS